MLPAKDFEKHAPSNTGEQIHINHVGCEAGTDHKKRLYIKRTEKGIVAYCHHCGQSGFIASDKGRLSTWLTKPTSKTTHTPFPTLVEMSIEGKMWLAKYYCDWTAKCFNGVLHEKHLLALDLNDHAGNFVGVQLRNLRPDAVPKYITRYYDKDTPAQPAWFQGDGKTLYITEDYLSAYRINRDTGFSALALLGTTMRDHTVGVIAALNFETIVVWLDPDDAGVKGAKKLRKQLDYYLDRSVKLLAVNGKEAKECTPTELFDNLTKGDF